MCAVAVVVGTGHLQILFHNSCHATIGYKSYARCGSNVRGYGFMPYI